MNIYYLTRGYDFCPLECFVLDLIEDVEQIYGRSVQQLAVPKKHLTAKDDNVRFGEMKKGELVVIVTRDKTLGDHFKCRLINHVACELGRSATIFSTHDYNLMFARKLISDLSNIPINTDIYSGQLNEGEFVNLSSALVALSAAELDMYPVTRITLDELCMRSRMNFQHRGEIGLIFVDFAENIMVPNPEIGHFKVLGSDNRCNQLDKRKSRLMGLKELAKELLVPVVITCQFEHNLEKYLSSHELKEMEILSDVADGVLFMSGTCERLAFTLPKITNAKPVKWIETDLPEPMKNRIWQKIGERLGAICKNFQ